MAIYLLKAPIIAIEHSLTGMLIVRIAAGHKLTLPDTDQPTGLIEIDYGGRRVAIFIEDLKERAEKVQCAGAL